MQPGKYDRTHPFLIAAAERRELKRHIEDFPQSFGLESPLQRYQGTRPIALYRWDLDLSWTFCRWRWMTETSILLRRARHIWRCKRGTIASNKNMTLPTAKVSG
jgi:hypothetical protein